MSELDRLRHAIWLDGDPMDGYYCVCRICGGPLEEFYGGEELGHAVDCAWMLEDQRRAAQQ